MGSIIGHRIDYNGVGVLRGQRHIPSKNWPKYPHHPPPPRGFLVSVNFCSNSASTSLHGLVGCFDYFARRSFPPLCLFFAVGFFLLLFFFCRRVPSPRSLSSLSSCVALEVAELEISRVSLICRTADRGTAEPAKPAEPNKNRLFWPKYRFFTAFSIMMFQNNRHWWLIYE